MKWKSNNKWNLALLDWPLELGISFVNVLIRDV